MTHKQEKLLTSLLTEILASNPGCCEYLGESTKNTLKEMGVVYPSEGSQVAEMTERTAMLSHQIMTLSHQIMTDSGNGSDHAPSEGSGSVAYWGYNTDYNGPGNGC